MLKRFAKNQSGNVAILTAMMAMPLLFLAAGAIDTIRHSRMKDTMQTAADAAVMAAFRGPARNWRKRQNTAHLQFRANLQKTRFAHGVQTKMSREMQKNRITFTYRAEAKLDSIFGDLSPFSGDRLSVQARAAWEVGSRKPPHLIGERNGGVTQVAVR